MNVESQITLEEFVLRPYQVPIYNALKEGKRRIIAVMPRRARQGLSLLESDYT
jgi:hypothetical protein